MLSTRRSTAAPAGVEAHGRRSGRTVAERDAERTRDADELAVDGGVRNGLLSASVIGTHSAGATCHRHAARRFCAARTAPAP